ncbi:MAG TPA: hypothetical protein VGD63_15985 [Steroidobacteraceae bacterium]
MSYQPGDAHYDLGNPPTEDPFVQGYAISLTELLLHFHDFKLSRNGTFYATERDFKFGGRLRADARSLAQDIASTSNRAPLLARRFGTFAKAARSNGFIEGLVAEDYNFEVGTWIGATLEQGVWYEMSAPLSWQLAPAVFIMHKIEFAFTRQVPCSDDSTDASCVEIVLRATIDPSALRATVDKLGAQVWSATYMRLVTDPATLHSYSREMRHYSYWFLARGASAHPLVESEKSVVRFSSIANTQ